MDIALLAFIATLLLSIGGSDHVLAVQLSQTLGRSQQLIVLTVIITALTILAWALIGALVADDLAALHSRWLAAGALTIAALRYVRRPAEQVPKEPTRSLGAIGLVFFAKQIVDAPRLVLFATAILGAGPIPVAFSGTLGALVALTILWLFGLKPAEIFRSAMVRVIMGLALVACALLIAFYTPQ